MKPINKYLVNRHVSKNDIPKKLTKEEVRSYIQSGSDKYCKNVTIRYEGNKPIVDIEGDFFFREDITEIPFQFGKVSRDFCCSNCKNLTSLKGCPEEVGENFICGYCNNLTSLEGCPQIVGGYFGCSYCYRLTSLEGCPKEVGGDFSCIGCSKKFKEKEVRSLCNIKGDIVC